ncbi:MAG: ABC transporter ATP-binding protein [Planctomycetota bacterium]
MTLRIDNLHFAYKDKDVLQGLTFEVPRGCLTAILGANGSGKTTLLRTINRLLKPRHGTVFIDGTAVRTLSGRRIAHYFGYMPQRQEPAHCTVFEAVLIGRKACTRGRADAEDLARTEEILRLVHLEDLAMRSAVQLSGGELQKVILARALAQDPKVLLLDEPINHLDPANQVEVMSLLHAVTRDLGITSLVVTHNLNNALQFADRFIFLKDGTLLAAGGREIVTPEVVRDAFRIDVIIEEVAGVPIVIPKLHGLRPHSHFDASGRSHEHTHEVDEHVYDHKHA